MSGMQKFVVILMLFASTNRHNKWNCWDKNPSRWWAGKTRLSRPLTSTDEQHVPARSRTKRFKPVLWSNVRCRARKCRSVFLSTGTDQNGNCVSCISTLRQNSSTWKDAHFTVSVSEIRYFVGSEQHATIINYELFSTLCKDMIMFKCLRDSAPAYLADYCNSTVLLWCLVDRLWDLLLMVTLLFLVIELTGVWDLLRCGSQQL